MTTSDWLYISSIISGVIGTLTLGVIAWLNIRQVRNTHKAERKERLLNEIIEWVRDVSNCRSTSPFIKYSEIKNMWEHNITTAYDEIDKFISLENQGEYIRKIAGKFREDLENAIDKVLSNIKEREMLLIKLMSVKPAVEIGEVKKMDESILSEVKKWRQYLSNKNKDTWDALSEEAKAYSNLGENAGELKKYISKVIEIAVEMKTKDIT